MLNTKANLNYPYIVIPEQVEVILNKAYTVENVFGVTKPQKETWSGIEYDFWLVGGFIWLLPTVTAFVIGILVAILIFILGFFEISLKAPNYFLYFQILFSFLPSIYLILRNNRSNKQYNADLKEEYNLALEVYQKKQVLFYR